jgi:hypothetical protein
MTKIAPFAPPSPLDPLELELELVEPLLEAPLLEAPLLEAPLLEAPLLEAPLREAPLLEAPLEPLPLEDPPLSPPPESEPPHAKATTPNKAATSATWCLRIPGVNDFIAGSPRCNGHAVVPLEIRTRKISLR